MKSCCEHHEGQLPRGCKQGRICPERTRRVQADDHRWSQDIGYEAAMPPVEIVTDELEPVSRFPRRAFGYVAYVYVAGLCLLFAAIWIWG